MKYSRLLSFLIPAAVRAIPEIISFPWPLGYDTITAYDLVIIRYQLLGLLDIHGYYFPSTQWAPLFYILFVGKIVTMLQTNPYLYAFLDVSQLYLFSAQQAPLLDFLIGIVGMLSQASPFLILEFVGPILSGFLGFSTFYFLTDYLGWDEKRALISAVFCVLYFVTLRLTWDLFRNVLGLIFLFLAFSQTKNLGERKRGVLFVLFSLLCIFSHELVAILLFVGVAYLLFLERFPSFHASDFLTRIKCYVSSKVRFLRGSGEVAGSEPAEAESTKGKKSKTLNPPSRNEDHTWYQKFFGTDARPWVLAMYIFIAISAVIFTLLYDGYFTSSLANPLNPSARGLLFDHISLSIDQYTYLTVDALRGDIFALFVFCFLPILPFAVLGYFRNHLLDVLTLFLLFGSFIPVVFPHSAIPYWNRWMFMLVFPFIIYACNFLLPDKQDSVLIRRLKISRKTRRDVSVVVISALAFLSFMYMVTPPENAFPYFSNFSISISRYFPSGMQYNTIPLSQCPYVVLAVQWLNLNMPSNSCLIVHTTLYGFTYPTLTLRPIYGYYSVDKNLNQALLKASFYNSTYVLTYPPYDTFATSSNFKLVFRLGLIEVFRSVD